MAVSVVNQWAGTFSQPVTFSATPPALQSVVTALTVANSVGGGTGVPTAGNWLFCLVAMSETATTSGFTVGIGDDIHSFWRPGDETSSTWAVSTGTALTRTAIWYTANTASAPGNVYVAPNGAFNALTVLIIEVSGLGAWDTVTGVNTNYAAAATTLNLALGAPSGNAFLLAAIGGDNTANGQAFAPASWTTLHTVSVTNGTDHTTDSQLNSAWITTSGSISVNGTASSAIDLSGAVIGVLTAATSPIPGSQNPNWPLMKAEAAFGGGFQTPQDQLTWTDLTNRTWSWDETTGVQFQLGQVQATNLDMEFDNNDNLLATDNVQSLFYGSGWAPTAGFYDGEVSELSPLAWWKLNDASGSGTAADSSGNGRTGTATSVTFGNASQAVTGNNSASFASASTSHILTTYNPGPLSAISVEAWVNYNSLSQGGNNPRLVANGHPDSDNKGFQLMVSNSRQAQFWVGNGTSNGNAAGGTIPTSGWAHLVGTYDGVNVKIYVNGILQTASTFSGTVAAGLASGIGLGYNPTYNGDYLNGLLAEAAVYGTALSAQEVNAHYTAGPVGVGVPVRIRAALGTLGGVTSNRWYVIQRNAHEWPQEINSAYRRYAPVTGTDIWSTMASSSLTPFRGEIKQDSPYAFWACDDQPLAGGVLPTTLRNSAPGNANTLAITQSAAGSGAAGAGAALPLFYTNSDGFSTIGTVAPSSDVYSVAAQQGWMYGDPQSGSAVNNTGNPVTSSPGSASWQASGEAGTIGGQGWFLACTDSNFPPLSGGITVEGWFNYAFHGTGTGFQPAWTGPATVGTGGTAMQTVTPQNTSVLGQPSMPLTILELTTASNPVAVLQLDQSGHLNLITYSGATPTSNSIYTGSDLRSNSWHHVAMTLTTTAWAVYVNGGATAKVSGSAAGMTSAWTTLIANGDMGTGGSSSTGLATAFVQKKNNTASSSSSLTVTLDRPTTAGNCLAVCVGINGAGVTVTGITLGGAAGNFSAAQTAVNGTSPRGEIWTDPNCSGGQTSVVVTLSGSATSVNAVVMEFSGIVTSTPVDQTASNTGTTVQTWASGTTAALAVPGEIAVGVVAIGATTVLTGPGTSWTNISQAGASSNMLAGWAPAASTAGLAYSGYTNTSGTNITYAAAVITLKPIGLAHSGNAAFAHLAVYPSRLPAWRIAAHYWAAFTAFGQIPAPTAVTMQWVSGAGTYVPDGSTNIPQAGPNALGGYTGANGVLASAVVTANTPAGLTSGPSPWASVAGYFPSASADMWVSWVGMAPQFKVYTGPNIGTEKQAALTCGSGDSFVNGYGLGAIGEGSGQTSGISVVQTAVPQSAFTSPVTIVLKNPTTAGNCLAVFISTGSTSVSSVTLGGAADNFAAAVSQVNSPAASGSAFIWVDPNCAGGQTSIVVTTGAPSSTSVLVMELSGVATSTPVDQTASQTTTAGTALAFTSTVTAAQAQTADVALGMVVGPIGTITVSATDPAEFTAFTMSDITPSTTDHAVAGIAGLSTTAGVAFDGTCTTNAAYAAVVATLKSTWSGSSPPVSASAAGDTVAQRIERVLGYGGNNSSPARCIDPASLAVQAATDIGGQQVNQNMLNIAQSDGGLLFVDNLGNLTYWQKSHLASQYSSPVWTLTPNAPPTAGASSTAIPYYREGFSWLADPQRVWNAIQITPYSPEGLSLASITPASSSAVNASQEQYGAQPLQINSYLQSQSEMQNQANWLLSNYGITQIRVSFARFDAAAYPAAWPLIVGVNIGDIVTCQNWQLGGGGPVMTFRVTSINRKIRFGDDREPTEASVTLTCDYEPPSYWT